MARDTDNPLGLGRELLVYPGGALKSLDATGDVVGGHVVLFGDPATADLSVERDFFNAETDYWLEDNGGSAPLLYKHGLTDELGPVRLGRVEVKTDKAGVWMQGEIKLRKEYVKKYASHVAQLKQAIKDGQMGLSSGSAPHLVVREPQKGGTNRVVSWPLVEVSITPTPADPRTQVRAIKSLFIEAKGEFLGPDAASTAAGAALERLADMARWRVYEILRDPKLDKAQKLAGIKGCFGEQSDVGLRLVEAVLDDPGNGAAVKTLLSAFGSGDPLEPFFESCLRAVSDLSQAAHRFVKVGPTKARAIKDLRDSLDALLTPPPPPATDLTADRELVDQLLTRLS